MQTLPNSPCYIRNLKNKHLYLILEMEDLWHLVELETLVFISFTITIEKKSSISSGFEQSSDFNLLGSIALQKSCLKMKFQKGKNEKLYFFLSFQSKIKSPLIFSLRKSEKVLGYPY